MRGNDLISIIINNYNYEPFVRQAIDSAIGQTYPFTEVVVVDDGSTDNSRKIIEGYGDQIMTVFKANGGQASAFNAGFTASKGDIVIFLDADDCLLPEAADIIAAKFDPTELSKAHWPLWVIDGKDHKTGQMTPVKKLQDKGLLEYVVSLGPNGYISPPTSGNAWARNFLSRVLPMPEEIYRISADNYLCMLAPLYGKIKAYDTALSLYRLHGKNNFRGKDLDENLLATKVDRYDGSCKILAQHLTALHIPFDQEQWHTHSWLKKLKTSVDEIKSVVAQEEKFILADDNQWQVNGSIAGRIVIPFKEKQNEYWGPPADDQDAITEIKRHVQDGARFIFFAWPAFWLLDHFKGMIEYLEKGFSCIIRNDRLVGYHLKSN